jgi:predicted O-methyltransferase YrrM
MTEKNVPPVAIHPDDAPMIRFRELALEISRSLPEDASFCEVGTRSGDSAILLLDAIRESGKSRWLFTVDPYGDKPYHGADSYDYGEQHYRNAMKGLSDFAYEHDLLHCHYRMRSQEFGWMCENIEFWYGRGTHRQKYGFVYLDGEHRVEAVAKELEYFLPRLVPGGVIVIDDIGMLGGAVPLDGEIALGKLWYRKS